MPFAIRPPPGSAGKAWPAISVGLFVAFGGVLFGYDTGTIGGILAMPFWLKQFSTGAVDAMGHPAITAKQSSEIVSLLSAGTFFGALTAAPTGDFFGRRVGLMICLLVFTVGVILQTAATEIPLFVAGRFVAGYGVGMISALVSRSSPPMILNWADNPFRSLCISLRPRPSGSEAPLSVAISWPSLSACCLPPWSITPPPNATTLGPTGYAKSIMGCADLARMASAGVRGCRCKWTVTKHCCSACQSDQAHLFPHTPSPCNR